MQSNKLFDIKDYNVWENDIEIFSDKKDWIISRSGFENWLRFSDRLNWEMNISDHNGNHVQETGVMSIEEYWSLDQNSIKTDLYDYVVIKVLDVKVFDVFQSLGNILNPIYSPVNSAK